MKPQSIFSNYRVESRHNNEVNFVTKTQELHIALKNLHESSSIEIQLKTRNGKEFLNIVSTSSSLYGSTTDETGELQVLIMSSDKMALIKEPTTLGTPDAYILLPSVSTLKPVVDRYKALGKFLTISATMNGKFKLEIETPAAKCKVYYENLNNPRLRDHVPTLEPDEYASVRIKTDDFSNFLNCYYLNPSNVICTISNELQVSLFVYLSIDVHQNEDAPIRSFNAMQTTLTCHLPVYYE
ncbi:unnamed protein product [Mucor hiemalis]